MTSDATDTTAETLSLTTGIPTADVSIEATGDALWDGDAGSDVPVVTLQIGGREAGLSVTLTAEAADALRDDLQDAIEGANDDVDRFADDQEGGQR
jgi:hypothetical protein